MKLTKGQEYEGIVTEVVFPNKTVVEIESDDKKGILVESKGGIPGQRVRILVTKIRHGKPEGRILSVVCPSKDEIEGGCPHAGECGGCAYQTLPYEKQLELKEEQMRKIFTPFFERQKSLGYSGIEVFSGVQGSPVNKAYRNKMEFSFGDAYKDGPLALGMHKKGSFYDILDVPECAIVDEDYHKILTTVLDFCKSNGWKFYHKLRHEGYLRHLLVRKAVRTGEILVAIVTTTQENHDVELKELADKLASLEYKGKMSGILHTRNDSLADVVQSDETNILYGQDYFYEEILGLKFKITEFSFFQTNSLGAEVLYNVARDFIGEVKKNNGEKPVLFDLYSGTGTIAQMMAPVASKVVGVEIVEEAVLAAKENAALNGIDNCEFLAGDVLKVIDSIIDKPDFIILDPPRDGIHPKALPKIIAYGVDRMVYISCKPTSLARDLEVFLDNGYVVEKMRCVDMFPGTVHVESVCLLSNRKADSHIKLSLDMDEYYDIIEKEQAENK
ncbi:MAG: 23S rRNA (uracil(1939)-C(5))-methyltransferase RlmD [Lachnospiraceae bacterium]|nr:23S rRNA (uracil(1939)-C(5))-methyltransferase RlmD [Candidatus Merdinaster equi]